MLWTLIQMTWFFFWHMAKSKYTQLSTDCLVLFVFVIKVCNKYFKISKYWLNFQSYCCYQVPSTITLCKLTYLLAPPPCAFFCNTHIQYFSQVITIYIKSKLSLILHQILLKSLDSYNDGKPKASTLFHTLGVLR